MNNISKTNRLIIIITIILAFSITACGQIMKRPQQKEEGQQASNEKKQPPKSLMTMEKNTEKIIQEIQKIKDQRAELKRRREENQGQKEGQEQLGENQQGQDQGSQNQGGQGQQGKNQEDKGQEKGQKQNEGGNLPKVNWTDLEKTVEQLHTLWNGYEPDAKKDGATNELVSGFESQLDALTNQVMAHNEDKTLAGANKLYQYYSRFLNLYKHKAPPETKEVIYYVRQVIIDGQQNQWDDGIKMLEPIKKAWQTAKARMDNPDKNLNQRIDNAIEDFERVVKTKNLHLTKMKGDIVLKNIQQIK